MHCVTNYQDVSISMPINPTEIVSQLMRSSSPISDTLFFSALPSPPYPRRRFFFPFLLPIPIPNSPEMRPESAANSSAGSPARVVTGAFFLAAVFFSCFVLYRGADSTVFKILTTYQYHNLLSGISFGDSLRLFFRWCNGFSLAFVKWRKSSTRMFGDSVMCASAPLYCSRECAVSPHVLGIIHQDRANYSLERVLKDAAMQDKTVILTFLNEAWGSPNSIIDLFLESFRIGEQTRRLLNHLVIVALDQKAFSRCLDIHTHCFARFTQGVNSSREAYFMTPVYLEMMWSRIKFLRSVLQLGFNFVFTDADIMWFRDPFPHFYSDADFQIACDHYTGKSDDLRNRPNGGFHFVRSNDRSIEFYKFWYSSREKYPGLHDQDVLTKIQNNTLVHYIGLKIRFLDTAFFGGFCEPSKDLNEVCTMHANCCFGLESKLHDLRILLKDWKRYMALSPRLKGSSLVSWRVPQNCSLDAFFHLDVPKKNESQLMEFDGRPHLENSKRVPN